MTDECFDNVKLKNDIEEIRWCIDSGRIEEGLRKLGHIIPKLKNLDLKVGQYYNSPSNKKSSKKKSFVWMGRTIVKDEDGNIVV